MSILSHDFYNRDTIQVANDLLGKNLTNGPAKLCQALAIDKSLNGWDLTCGKTLWLENYRAIPEAYVCVGPNIGIDYAAPKDRKANLRFYLDKHLNIGP